MCGVFVTGALGANMGAKITTAKASDGSVPTCEPVGDVAGFEKESDEEHLQKVTDRLEKRLNDENLKENQERESPKTLSEDEVRFGPYRFVLYELAGQSESFQCGLAYPIKAMVRFEGEKPINRYFGIKKIDDDGKAEVFALPRDVTTMPNPAADDCREKGNNIQVTTKGQINIINNKAYFLIDHCIGKPELKRHMIRRVGSYL